LILWSLSIADEWEYKADEGVIHPDELPAAVDLPIIGIEPGSVFEIKFTD
jgi:hypothetical protein